MIKIILCLFLFSGYAIAENDTITTATGLKYIVISKGSGDGAVKGKAVEVHYTGLLLDGKKFDSSYDRKEPIEFILGEGQVIKGWDEGIGLMNIGDKMRLIIPPQLGYGDRGAGNVIPPGATLVFDVELLSVSEPKKSLEDTLIPVFIEKGLQAMIETYKSLKVTSPDEFNFKESQLNSLGYTFLQGNNIDAAIEIFKLNTESYPESFNVFDSLGEACMIKGDNENAILYYEKSLQLNPENTNATDMLKKLKQ